MREIYPSGSHFASGSVALPVVIRRTVAGYHLAMRPISEIRRDRLRSLAEEFGSQAALAVRICKDRRQVSAWLTDPAKPGAKSMREDTAREIEALCLKHSGWLDHEPSQDSVMMRHDLQAGSQSVGLDEAMLHDSLKVIELMNEISAGDPVPFNSRTLKLVYDYITARNERVTDSNIIDFSRAIAKRLRGQDERNAGETIKSA